MNKIHKGDCVIARTGKDKDKQGAVLAALAEHATVEGVSIAKKHVRPNSMLGVTGGVVDKVMPIHIPNVALVDVNGKSLCVGIKVEGGVKMRVLKTTGVVAGA